MPIATATKGGPMSGITAEAMNMNGIMDTTIPVQPLGVTTNTQCF